MIPYENTETSTNQHSLQEQSLWHLKLDPSHRWVDHQAKMHTSAGPVPLYTPTPIQFYNMGLLLSYNIHSPIYNLKLNMATKDKDQKDDEKASRSGIPKDWIAPNMQISADVKFCDMNVSMKEYAMLITEYIYVQMVKTQIAYLKDAAENIKKGFEAEFGGCWHVVCGVNFGSHFSYESKACILLYRNHVGFLIWKFG